MRAVGRRKSDRWRVGIGIMIGAVLVGYALYTAGCDAAGPTRPDEARTEASAPVAAVPAPAPTAAPGFVADPPAGFELTCSANSTLSVKYTGSASRARVDTWYTSFDNQNLAIAKQQHTVNSGDTLTRAFGNVCIQGDADQPGVKEIGGCFFDKDGKPFSPSRNPERVTACRTVPCLPDAKESWVEDEEYEDGEWSSCSPNNQPPSAVTSDTQQCYRKKTRTWISINICTKEKRYRTIWVYEPCECPCVETTEPRETPGVHSWAPEILQGACEVEVGPIVIGSFTTPQLNCRQIGTQKIAIDWLCKADGERVRNLCRNVACPTPPTCANTPASSSASQGFSLANSGEATETAWVNGNVVLGPYELVDKDDNVDGNQDGCTPADISGGSTAKVALVKAGTKYRYYLNVSDGQNLCSFDGKGISHISYFRCD